MTTTPDVKTRPILFSGPMIRALLDDTKTQTRRIIDPQPEPFKDGWRWEANKITYGWPEDIPKSELAYHINHLCPYGQAGDYLWCRESWRAAPAYDDVAPRNIPIGSRIWYEADEVPEIGYRWGKLRPSIFLPRWASRITLELTSVRVERVQDISEEDARAEGIRPYLPPVPFPADWPRNSEGKYTAAYGTEYNQDRSGYATSARNAFQGLWDSINARRGYSFESNPWVWCLGFRRVEA